MTFLSVESSVELGSPLELYDIRYLTAEWFYTSGDVEYYDAVTDKTYQPIAVTRGSLEFSSDFSRGTLDLAVQYDTPFLDVFRTAAPSGVVSMTVRKVHRLDGANEIITVWKGRILNVNWVGSEAQLMCQTIRSSLERFGLRRVFQFNCPYALYSEAPECGVDKALYAVVGNVLSVSESTVSVVGANSFSAGYFAGGYIEYINSILNTTERRMITSNAGGTNAVVLVSPPLNLDVGTSVTIYPGCDHTLATCASKFSNSESFGGFPHTPTNNGPFSGETIY